MCNLDPRKWKFNYQTQSWFGIKEDGTTDANLRIESYSEAEPSTWNFSCPLDDHPAELISVSCYYERHKCLVCGHEFDVS